jgi:hypothetical protein
MASKTIIDVVIKKHLSGKQTPAQHYRQTHYHMSCCRQQKCTCVYESYKATVNKSKNKIVYYKETEYQHLIFWPQRQRRGAMLSNQSISMKFSNQTCVCSTHPSLTLTLIM